jgi:hypothetical protein
MQDINMMSIKEFGRVLKYFDRKDKSQKGEFIKGLDSTSKRMIKEAKNGK